MAATTILALICWIASGKIRELPELLLTNKLALLSTALFFLLIAGVFYSPAETGDALSTLKKYRELILFVMTLSYLREKASKAELAEKFYLAGSILLLSISYSMYFGLIPTEKFGYSTVYHITHSFFMAILAFWALQKIIVSPNFRIFWCFIFIATDINLFYIAPGRTGMFVFVALAFLTIFQHLSLKKSLIGMLICGIATGATFISSENFSTGFHEAVVEIQNYHPGSSRTSLGMRFDWWHNSISLIKEKPLLGHGTGSFEVEQKRLIKGTKTMKSDNPHNEYLLIGVQVGLVGVVLYLTLLGGLFGASFKKRKPYNFLLQGVVVAMFCGCLMNSFLFDSHQGHFFAIISAILISTQTKVLQLNSS